MSYTGSPMGPWLCVTLVTLSSVAMLGSPKHDSLGHDQLSRVKLRSVMLVVPAIGISVLGTATATATCFKGTSFSCCKAVDHYAGDLKILDDLLGLKQRYGLRVHFVLGNRPLEDDG